jgi:hypothetical protein
LKKKKIKAIFLVIFIPLQYQRLFDIPLIAYSLQQLLYRSGLFHFHSSLYRMDHILRFLDQYPQAFYRNGIGSEKTKGINLQKVEYSLQVLGIIGIILYSLYLKPLHRFSMEINP